MVDFAEGSDPFGSSTSNVHMVASVCHEADQLAPVEKGVMRKISLRWLDGPMLGHGPRRTRVLKRRLNRASDHRSGAKHGYASGLHDAGRNGSWHR